MVGFPEWLAERLKHELPGKEAQLKMVPPASRTNRFEPMLNPVLSGVLLLLFKKGEKWQTVFIKRPVYNGAHSGQISLPGGKKEEADKDLSATALRETFEEVGVNPDDVQLLGKLTTVQIPVSGFIVEPYVGYIGYEPIFIPDPGEVKEVITAELSLFTDPDIRDVFTFVRGTFSIEAPYYKLHGEKLWGATAMMISEFEEIWREYSEKRTTK
ncbi:NUDIX hydrolase [Saccharicrinis sp. FJH54]|uniref:NUDIX hydrolase n=1 Tax=Saccharicrinis sp. FJH54 TaxID=3344665 RepID=UPI0035D4437F